ncbi:E3 ubiquitin-protein ligase SINA-like 6 [Carex littledalei]|uniref:RING-type E3 ubiquitin transferase n=1 Tax=Carex littledalei TaxID=544730 RepID=A0A833VZK0_9POAL|nr:E3 ubiquitin-protein ligase SINA-like 6 [Carex littledalei]
MAPMRKKTQTGEGETSNPPPPPPPQKETGGREEVGVTINPSLLKCSICFKPLCPPVFQCLKGHVACPSCWSKRKDKCPICGDPVGAHIIALEVLKSVHLPCPNANLGCPKSFSYSQMQVHADMCEFGPTLCPIEGCAHKASSGEWREHFRKDHQGDVFHFCDWDSYDNLGESRTIIRFGEEDLKEDRCYTILGPGKDLFLLVKEPILNVGNALSLYYIDMPDLGRNYFKCELKVKGGPYQTSSLQLKSRVVSIKEWKRGKVHGSSLLLPSEFMWARYMKLDVSINKKKL